MEEATTTDILQTEVIIIEDNTTQENTSSVFTSSDVVLPLETSAMTSYESTSTDINNIFDSYFSILPSFYLLLLISIGITSILVYTIYSYFDE